MKRELLDTPKRLAATTYLGGLLSACAFVWMGRQHGPNRSIAIFISFAVVVVGFLVSARASSALKDGINNQRWPNGAVDSLRSAVHHPTWTAANVLLSFFAIAAVFERSMFDFSWALLIVVQTMLEIRNAVRPSRKPPGPGNRIDWGNGAPLRSDHWGER